MKTKQAKEELDKSNEDEISSEPKTRARKKASDVAEEEKNRTTQDEPKTSKEPKKNATKPRAVVKKRPLGIRKTLRSKKVAAVKDKIKTVVKKTVKRGRKAAIKVESDNSQEKETTSLIPASEIKKEPTDDTTPNSRSSSPKTAGRRQRLSSDIMMMKSVLGDSPSSLVLGPRTSPYSMRSERSNSPSMTDGKNLRSGKPRKAKSNLLNEVVMKEQKKRRLISDTKNIEATDPSDDCKKLKRGRSCSRDGSEISKCSDITESDLSMTESINDSEGKELNKKIDKSKTDLEIDNQNNVQISTIEKVPSLDSKLAETKPEETNCIVNEKTKRKLSLKRSTSLDSDNNNSNRLKLESLNSSDLEDKSSVKTENDTLFAARSSILTSMSKTFNSKEVSKNIRKARRGRKAAASTRPSISPSVKNDSISIANIESSEDKPETLESLSKEINDLINDLDQNIDGDNDSSKYLSKPLGDNNSIATPETPSKDKDTLTSRTNESTPMKIDENDSENIKLHYEDDSVDKPDNCKQEKAYKGPNVSIDLLMDRLKVFEEFDKRRQRQESDSKSNDSITVMVSNDVVLIPKSGADIKLKDIHTVRSPERLFERESVLSSLENNSAISIVKREQVRKSVDIDLPNSVTLIKRNSVSSRKESTSSNHSRESDAISIFEKSLGKDVTLTEIRKSVDKPPAAVDLNQFATLHPNNPNQSIGGVTLDPKQISITPRVMSDQKITNDVEKKRSSRDSLSRKSSESADQDEKMASVEKIKSPIHHVMSEITITPTPIAVKCPEVAQPVETEALPAPLEKVKDIPEETTMTSDVAKIPDTPVLTTLPTEAVTDTDIQAELRKSIDKPPEDTTLPTSKSETESSVEKMDVDVKTDEEPKTNIPDTESDKTESVEAKPVKETKSARNSIESQPGPSNVLHETPESQKRKESVLRTLGLLTHKAAKEVKIEKLKEKERIFNGLGTSKKQASKSGDYTGTLKTVIKLNRGGDKEKKRHRSSLKMTFQKSKHRAGKPAVEPGDLAHDESYYTIERREGGAGATTDGGHRKSHYSNRLNNHDPEVAPEPTEPKETLNLVIPEKASSFSIHPGRLCQDQCFYCGGKFGLFDTPCHIAQMKSSDRQKKVLANEEKLAIDSCLCDACYRHVDRRANCPSYRSRPLTKHLPGAPPPPPMPADQAQADKPPISPPLEEESEEEPGAASSGRAARCHTEGCRAPADHSMRRKWLIKMRASVNNVLKLEGDYPGLHTIPLCGAHWRLLAPLMACALCRRRLTKHHNLHFVHAFQELNPLLKTAGLPVQFSERLVVCKLCRHYCTLLLRPGTQDPFTGSYRRKLLQVYNIEVPPESEPDIDELNINIPEDPNSSVAKKKKVRTKSKQRKSADPEKPDSESSEKTESSPEKDKPNDTEVTEPENETAQGLEEDIESLISSNKIPVPGAKPPDAPQQSDSSEDAVYDFETHALLPVDKQTELQYLLQKQNNPAQFLKTNLTQKQKNITKIQNVGIQKPGQQQRIHDKNAKRLQKLGQSLLQKEKQKEDVEMMDQEKIDNLLMLKMANIPLSDECTIETVANKKPADINTLKNKWQMSESFTQVKKNLSELSKKFTVEKDPKKPSDKNYFNPVKRLETNPSISVRELFPGEEEMNLQCNIEFNNVKGVTPEGWEKCNSVIQYDSETKKLWTELQRPYGNQSSFLRHLILLEKYFRNGDLVLSHNATPHALTYSDSVQSRLRAYDNVPTEVPKRSESSNLIEFRKKPSVNGKSLLKSNQEEKDPKKSMPPPPGVLPKKPSKGKAKPPELIAITPSPQGHKVTPNVLHNIQQLVKGVSASDPTEVAAAPLPLKSDPKPDKPDPPHAPHVPHPPHAPPPEKKEAPKDQPKKQKPTSKPWRPKLMPIIPENLAKIAREPPQVAVDGRHLPSLVQVMSSGKRYHITLQDYNKMCIMRREKLQQLHDGEKKKEDTVITEIQPSAMLGNGGTLVQNKPTEEEKKDMPELNQISSNAANILKNVGLKNITIAPIPPKTATVTSATVGSAAPAPPALLVSTPQKIPNLGPALSITSETIIAPTLTTLPLPILPTLPTMSTLPTPTSALIMPKIPKSLTVIPQGMILHPVVAPGSEPPRP